MREKVLRRRVMIWRIVIAIRQNSHLSIGDISANYNMEACQINRAIFRDKNRAVPHTCKYQLR